MLLTEEEAKTRWCHASRVIAGTRSAATKATLSLSGAVFNRIELGPSTVAVPDGAACLGSGCMAWRWREGEFEQTFVHPDDDRPPAEDGWVQCGDDPNALPGHNASMTLWRRRRPIRHGYCGLAGRPG